MKVCLVPLLWLFCIVVEEKSGISLTVVSELFVREYGRCNVEIVICLESDEVSGYVRQSSLRKVCAAALKRM
ncbi:Protein of unknown function [Gryllus bimaculatus]|nr:Protein of unknown function [Gryllus bimaculatus]